MTCPECDGRGKILDAPNRVLDGVPYTVMCPECDGAGTVFVLSELEMRALVRQTFYLHITHEGTSGPTLHALLDRIRQYVGPAKMAAFVAEPPRRKRLTPLDITCRHSDAKPGDLHCPDCGHAMSSIGTHRS
jgi:hypothetical protein